MNFEELTTIRNEKIDNVQSWTWIKTDDGAWTGPKDDWNGSHRGMIEKHVPTRRLVVQAGGNQGMYPRLLSDMFDMVITFEPDPLNFYCLEKNCADKPNILKFPFALGDTDNKQLFLHRETMQNTGMHTVVETPTEQSITIRTLDSFMIGTPLSFLMLDVEGYEYPTLVGAMDTIKKYKPVIQVERDNISIQSLLYPLGYKVVDQSKMDTIYKIA